MAQATQAVLIDTVRALHAAGLPVRRACQLTGLPRATFYRLTRGYQHYRPAPSPIPHDQRLQPAALSPAERGHILQLLARHEFADLSVQQTYWCAFDQGLIACSERTFYRVAEAAKLTGDRRRTRPSGPSGSMSRPARHRPTVAAAAPNELWSWDTTELRGPGRERYRLTLIIDVYSRYPIGWCINYHESTSAARDLFAQAITRHGPPHTVHSDNGAVMRSHELVNQLHQAGILTSYSRPRISNDNPFSESMFKTIKYDLNCPNTFTDIDHARTWTTAFLHRYATQHHHQGLAHHTPETVHNGTAHTIRTRRQQHLDHYHAQHPERFRKPPTAPTLQPTGINLSQTG